MSTEQPSVTADTDPSLLEEVEVDQYELTQGYENINFANAQEYHRSGKTLVDFLKDFIIVNFPDEQFSFVEIKEESRPTNYLRNPRRLMTFIIEDSLKTRRVFVFDIASCLI